MISYHHIQVEFTGRKYPARLYGDRIEIPELEQVISRKEITGYKLGLFSDYRLFTSIPTFSKFKVAQNGDFARWLDRFYFTRLVLLSVIAIVSALVGFYILGLSGWWAVLFYAGGNSAMAYWFWQLIRKPAGKIYLYTALVATCAGLGSFFVFPFAMAVYLAMALNLVACLLLYQWLKTVRVLKVYLVVCWFLLNFCAYNLMLFIFTSTNRSWARNLNSGSSIAQKENKQYLVIGDYEFKVPFIWRLEKGTGDLFRFRDMLFNLNPFDVEYIFTYEQGTKTVLLSTSKFNPGQTGSLITRFNLGQSGYIYALYIARTGAQKIEIPGMGGEALLQGHVLFDLSSLKRHALYTLIVPSFKGRFAEGSVVFSFLLEEEVPAETVSQIILNGFENGRPAASSQSSNM